uniref:hypothetical protein n=1 Tax=Algoriphagus sp. TaxID=1872435 RepID=UPI0040483F8C
MKKMMFLVFLLVSMQGKAQDFFFKTGVNQTAYKFKDSDGISMEELLPGVGSSYQAGFGLPLYDYWVRYEGGITVDSYNASGGDTGNTYRWNTTYGGLRNSVGFFPLDGDLTLGILGNFGISRILSGAQTINNSENSLMTEPEFKGVMMQPGLGLSVSYHILNNGYLTFDYDYSRTLRLKNNLEEKLSFATHRILFGVHFHLEWHD